MASSTPVTATVCGVFQLAGVKISVAGETVPSSVLLDASAIVTSAAGLVSSTILNEAANPFSPVSNSVLGETVTPGVAPGMNTKDATGTKSPTCSKTLLGKSRVWISQPVALGSKLTTLSTFSPAPPSGEVINTPVSADCPGISNW